MINGLRGRKRLKLKHNNCINNRSGVCVRERERGSEREGTHMHTMQSERRRRRIRCGNFVLHYLVSIVHPTASSICKRNTSAYFEFQVSAGGDLDVDVELKDPQNQVIYTMKRATYDSHQFTAETTGVYTACFSNKFSAFSHKIVYVDFQVGEEPALPGVDEHATVLTQMETSSQSIHKALNDILDAQTHHRLREAQGFRRAELINHRVMLWASLETASVALIGIVQILILRNFFTDRKPSQQRYERL